MEKLVINDIYDFSKANLDRTEPNSWYNPEKNRAYISSEIRENLLYHTEFMEGYYIRPTCTSEASFVSSYNSRKDNSLISDIPDTLKNLSIEVKALIITLIIILGASICMITHNKNQNNIK